MKNKLRIFSIAMIGFMLIGLSSCITTSTKVKRYVSLGMTKDEVVNAIGEGYVIFSVSQTPEGVEEVLQTEAYPRYNFHFLDNILVEYYLYVPPQPIMQEVRTVVAPAEKKE